MTIRFFVSAFSSATLTLALAACGGSAPPPEEPEPTLLEEEPAPAPPPEPEPAPEPVEEPPVEPRAAVPEPEFKEGMSVEEAINAVPKGTERLNIDPDTLGTPLREFSVYEPCNVSQTQHFKLRVAVWQGRAVGIDVSSKPKNPKLEACIRQQVSELKWVDKVPSLNTVEYEF